ncbi:MAG: putative patatin/cPLA2 family phospholipase [Salibacteraceae bacterium]|jgi:predicted patatin/cPLA2 family phospholipase
MRINDQDWNILDIIRAFFPFQLIIAHLKHNLFSLLFWVVLFFVVNGNLGAAFGIPLLFHSPEYLGEVSSLSFLLLGFALGGFIMGFNTYSYIKLGALFPFLITINRPFFKFCINNALIPAVFISVYLFKMIGFQRVEELATTGEVIMYSISFLAGIILFLGLSFLFFFRLTKNNKSYEVHSTKPISSVTHKNDKWYEIFRLQKDRTYIYIGKKLRLMPSRSSKHFDKDLVEKIYAKNRVNASTYEIITILIFFGLGIFSDSRIFEVPASASIVLLLTIVLMLFSALHSWLKGWVYPVFIVTILLLNYLSQVSESFHYTSYAYGLNYDKSDDCAYSMERIAAMAKDDEANQSSYDSYIKTLENWKKNTGEEKPKLIIINTSGGGSRSALWTVSVLQELQKASDGDVMNHTQLITGASGGMVGAAYYRELALRERLGKLKSSTDQKYREKISKDMLNKLAFMASTHDIFIRYQKVKINGQSYTMDRGYAFESQLHKNTDGTLKHNLGYYAQYEKKGTIPTMIFTPTIVNDGRRLFISSQPTNFITSGAYASTELSNSYENIDIQNLLNNQNVNNLEFSTVLRASATFPFVMPMITLPTRPEIQLMDAGIRDNYGGKTMIQFLDVMEDWIAENTSGVVVLQIRDVKKVFEKETFRQVSFLDKLFLPFGNMYKNFPRVQDYNQDELIKIGVQSMDFPVDVVSFNLLEKKSDYISLSWHLTKHEKNKIYKAIESKENKASLERLLKLIH